MTAARLATLSDAGLRRCMSEGHAPDPARLVGWEFRGLNLLPVTRLLGIEKFKKGFYLRPGEDAAAGRIHGYNVAVEQNGPDAPWRCKPSEGAPKRHGFYDVYPSSLSPRFRSYADALLLDYGVPENPGWDPSRVLRDYLVQPDPDDGDVLLGHAWASILGAVCPVGFFVLERDRPRDWSGPGGA